MFTFVLSRQNEEVKYPLKGIRKNNINVQVQGKLTAIPQGVGGGGRDKTYGNASKICWALQPSLRNCKSSSRLLQQSRRT